jgi:hydrogenase maturation factor HypE
MTAYVKSSAVPATFRAGTWEFGMLRGSSLIVGGEQVVGSRVAAIASATGGTVIDSEARTAIDAILAALRQHGLVAS